MTWKILENFEEIHNEIVTVFFLERINDHQGYSSLFHLENFNFELEKSWKIAYEKVWEPWKESTSEWINRSPDVEDDSNRKYENRPF